MCIRDRNEIGAIRIGPQETHFQIPRTISDKFAEALVRTAGDESNGGDVTIELSPEAPRDAARARKKGAPNAGRKGSPYVKKHRKGNAGPGKPKGGKPGNKPGGDKRGK